MKAHTLETQATITPEKALLFLQEGNQRFVNNLKVNRNLLEQVNDTREGQWPFATVLSCIDSRTSAELIFDQGLGDIFSIRIAGNFANQDILGSMEFACNVAGSKLVVVLGHTKCGALKGGLDAPQIEGLGMDNLNHLIYHFESCIHEIIKEGEERSSKNDDLLDTLNALQYPKNHRRYSSPKFYFKKFRERRKNKNCRCKLRCGNWSCNMALVFATNKITQARISSYNFDF